MFRDYVQSLYILRVNAVTFFGKFRRISVVFWKEFYVDLYTEIKLDSKSTEKMKMWKVFVSVIRIN